MAASRTDAKIFSLIYLPISIVIDPNTVLQPFVTWWKRTLVCHPSPASIELNSFLFSAAVVIRHNPVAVAIPVKFICRTWTFANE
jgi:hypothetical protein